MTATAEEAAPPPEAVARVEAALGDIRDRQRCNRLTGCPPLTALMQDREAAVPLVLKVLATEGGGDKYWIEMLVDFLGQTSHPSVLPALVTFLRDRRWSIKIHAAVGLGRCHAHLGPMERELLSEAELMAAASGDLAMLAAVAFARSRAEPERASEHRAKLLSLYPKARDAVLAISPPILDWLILIATEARLTEAAPALRAATLSDNRFASVNAMKAVGRFQDTGAIPFLLTRLEDPQPGVRRAALAALQNITGNHRMDRPQDWQRWAEQHDLAQIPPEEVVTP